LKRCLAIFKKVTFRLCANRSKSKYYFVNFNKCETRHLI